MAYQSIYDEDYTGPRFTYGLRNRPAGIGCQPADRIVGGGREHDSFRYGTIAYPFELSKQDIYDYELTKVEECPKGDKNV